MNTNRSRWLVVLLAAALLAVAGCSKQQAAAPAGRAVPVSVAPVRTRDVPIELRAIGTVEAYATVSVKSQVSGQVMQVFFQEGQDVSKGDPLFLIDKRPFEVVLEQAEAAQARDKAQLANAEAQEQRYAKLWEAGVVAREQYDQFRTSLDALRAVVRADEAAIQQARLNLSYCEIRSPIDGRTGRVMVYAGNVVKANEDPVMVVINQVNPIYVNFAIPEQYLGEIRKRREAGKLEVGAFLQDDPHAETGVLAFVDNSVDASTGTIRLKGAFGNASRRLWPGQFVNAVLKLSEQRGAVVVPSQAVQTGQSGPYVFVVKPDMTAEARPVTLGRTYGGDTVIEKGVAAGETVVTDGQIRLVTGTKVELKTASPGQD